MVGLSREDAKRLRADAKNVGKFLTVEKERPVVVTELNDDEVALFQVGEDAGPAALGEKARLLRPPMARLTMSSLKESTSGAMRWPEPTLWLPGGDGIHSGVANDDERWEIGGRVFPRTGL